MQKLLELEYSKESKKYRVSRRFVYKVLESALQFMKLRSKEGYKISVAIVGGRAIQMVNRRFRGKDSVTDVISVSGAAKGFLMEQRTEDLGEILICYHRAVAQAKEHGIRLHKEVAKLLIHGFLHNLGYDHEKEAEAKVMEGKERRLLSALLSQKRRV